MATFLPTSTKQKNNEFEVLLISGVVSPKLTEKKTKIILAFTFKKNFYVRVSKPSENGNQFHSNRRPDYSLSCEDYTQHQQNCDLMST